MKKIPKLLSVILCISLFVVFCMGNYTVSAKSKKMKMNKTKVTLAVGKSVKLKVKNAKGKIKWSSSNKKVAIVNKKGIVKGKRPGKATITAKVKKKKIKCKIIVKYISVSRSKAGKKIASMLKKHGKTEYDEGIKWYYWDKVVASSSGATDYVSIRYSPKFDVIEVSDFYKDTYITWSFSKMNSKKTEVSIYNKTTDEYAIGDLFKAYIDEENAVTIIDANFSSERWGTVGALITASTKVAMMIVDLILSDHKLAIDHTDFGFYF